MAIKLQYLKTLTVDESVLKSDQIHSNHYQYNGAQEIQKKSSLHSQPWLQVCVFCFWLWIFFSYPPNFIQLGKKKKKVQNIFIRLGEFLFIFFGIWLERLSRYTKQTCASSAIDPPHPAPVTHPNCNEPWEDQTNWTTAGEEFRPPLSCRAHILFWQNTNAGMIQTLWYRTKYERARARTPLCKHNDLGCL